MSAIHITSVPHQEVGKVASLCHHEHFTVKTESVIQSGDHIRRLECGHGWSLGRREGGVPGEEVQFRRAIESFPHEDKMGRPNCSAEGRSHWGGLSGGEAARTVGASEPI